MDIKRQELIAAANSMRTIRVYGRLHVIRPISRLSVSYRKKIKTTAPDVNYKNTKCGLCGILQPEETLHSFRKKWIISHST